MCLVPIWLCRIRVSVCQSFFVSLLLISTLPHPQLPTVPCKTIHGNWESFVTIISILCYLLSSGKGSGGLNLGNFFASRKGYSRKGFDRLSTEGSDQEKDEDDGSESEEEYSAPLPPPAPPSSWVPGFGQVEEMYQECQILFPFAR